MQAHRHAGTQADADAGADAKHAWWRQRDGPTHRRTPSLHATTFTPTQKQSQHGTHVLLALL